jgi:hypothetical protein
VRKVSLSATGGKILSQRFSLLLSGTFLAGTARCLTGILLFLLSTSQIVFAQSPQPLTLTGPGPLHWLVGKPLPPGLVYEVHGGDFQFPYQLRVTTQPPTGISVVIFPGNSTNPVPTFTLQGTPLVTTYFAGQTFSFNVVDRAGQVAVLDIVITIFTDQPAVITGPTVPPVGTVGVPYRIDFTANGGNPPYHWELLNGPAPPGLGFSTVGSISGTPTSAGAYQLSVLLRDVADFAGTPAPFVFTILIRPKVITSVARTSALPHLAAGDIWTTGFSVINTGAQQADFSIAFYDDNGRPISLPIPAAGSFSTNPLAGTLPAYGSAYYETSTSSSTLLTGWGLVTADPAIVIQALFRSSSNGTYYEAAVPSSAGSKEFLIPFDATSFSPTGAPLYTGFAISNLDPTTATITCTAQAANGTVIANAVPVPPLSPLGHWANYLFPALTGQRGTIDCVSDNNIAAIALRSIGGKTISSLPVIGNPANLSQQGGSTKVISALPHIAAGDVWTTGFSVINAGSQPADFSIVFYDDSGRPISLPIAGPAGFSTNPLAGTLSAHGSAYFEAGNSSVALVTGWGQITADHSIVVQALFRSNSNGTYFEAAVPANAGSKEFLIPFDASGFLSTQTPLYTGFAISNLDPTTATVNCSARNANGTLFSNGVPVPSLSPRGHWANYLFPDLAGQRGTIDCVSQNNIAAIALRSIGTRTFSSLPVINEGGGASNPSLPAISFTVDQPVITIGQSTTLHWTVTNATKVSIDQGIGAVNLIGSQQIIPPSATTYTLTASGQGGSQTASVDVSVSPANGNNKSFSGSTTVYIASLAGGRRLGPPAARVDWRVQLVPPPANSTEWLYQLDATMTNLTSCQMNIPDWEIISTQNTPFASGEATTSAQDRDTPTYLLQPSGSLVISKILPGEGTSPENLVSIVGAGPGPGLGKNAEDLYSGFDFDLGQWTERNACLAKLAP